MADETASCENAVVVAAGDEVDRLGADVFSACRDGDISRLRSLVDGRLKDEVRSLVASKTNGASSLIMACRNGHAAVVSFLVTRCHADIEQVGSVTFDGEVIEGAPPLWCAAAAGHFDIVKFLIRSGADVNKTTLTNSTPLRAACFDGHTSIVQYLIEKGADLEIANRHGHTCLMIACYKGHIAIVRYLLDKGADVKRKSLKGNTALHDCAESGSLEIMKMLFTYGAIIEKDSYGLTPLLAAAVAGHARIVEHLTSLPQCSIAERIDALELLGATFVDKKRDVASAAKVWKIAMLERQLAVAGSVPDVVSTPVEAYSNALEPRTTGELAELVLEPDAVRMNALVVRERILGAIHPDTAYYVRYRGAVYADSGDFARCILLWTHAVDMQRSHLDPLSVATQSSFLSFAELFVFMMDGGRRRRAVVTQPPLFDDVLRIFDRAVDELERGMTAAGAGRSSDREKTAISRFIVIVVHLIALAARVASTESTRQRLRSATYSVVRMNPRGTERRTPLHLACSTDTTDVGRYPVARFPDAGAISALLDAGADIDAFDADRNTPLHTAARCRPVRQDIIELLLERGAHPDITNSHRQTPQQLLDSPSSSSSAAAASARYMTLQCLAARTITAHCVSYHGYIPRRLEAFILLH